ncbi:MAG: pilus assembly protein PilP [Bdellovibrionales bacterium]|nr:pilus assembly protein PilP [Bdellovibrionales bacterium]
MRTFLIPFTQILFLALSASAQQAGQLQMQIPLPGAAGVRPGARPGQPVPSGVDPFAAGQNVPAAPVSQVFSSEGIAGVDALLTEEIIRSLRDPFSPPASLAKKEAQKSELETFPLKAIHLNGVITGPKKVRAMITGPNGKVYFIAVGEKLGVRMGRVISIQSDLIKVVEYDVDDQGKRIPEIFEVRLTGELVSLSKKEDL